MLAAILLNPYAPAAQDELVTSGYLRGYGFKSSSTSWNPNWSEDYGPDFDRAKKAKPREIQKAIKAIKEADQLPEYFEDAVDIVETRDLAAQLMEDEPALITVMTAYYNYIRYRKEFEKNYRAAVLLLL